MILAPTHEEEVTKLIGAEIDSAKALPVRVYQIGRKFRDEPRPRAGLLRTKEFLMKDMYSFDASVDQAKQAYEDTRQAYAHIFNRLFDWHHVPALVSSCAPTWLEVCCHMAHDRRRPIQERWAGPSRTNSTWKMKVCKSPSNKKRAKIHYCVANTVITPPT